jgi:hypothetical protein
VYVYELRRQVLTTENAPLFVGLDSARQRADAGAKRSLDRTLAEDHDLVPCVTCGRLQPSMARLLRRKWLVWIFWLWVGLVIATVFGYESAAARFAAPGAWVYWLPLIGTAAAIAGVVWACKKEYRAELPGRGQLKAEAEAEGYVRLTMPRFLGGGWIWERATRFEPPRVCARCGAEASKSLWRRIGAGLLQMDALELEARVCRRCYWRAQGLRGMWSAVCVAGSMVVMYWLFQDWPNALLAAVISGAFVGGFVLIIVQNWWLGRAGFPIRFRRYRPRQDSVELKFVGEAAGAAFVEEAIGRLKG